MTIICISNNLNTNRIVKPFKIKKMKKLESIFGYLLVILFSFLFIDKILIILGYVGEFDLLFGPFKVDVLLFWSGLGLLLSWFGGINFPSWNVSEYIKSRELSDLSRFEIQYQTGYYHLFIAFIGLLFWSGSSTYFNVLWWIGAVFIAIFFLIFVVNPIHFGNSHSLKIFYDN